MRKVCEDYGLNLISKRQALRDLDGPLDLSHAQEQTKAKEIELSADIFEELLEKILKNSTNN